MNRVVFIMGGSGAGKTTLRTALVTGRPNELKAGTSKVTIYDNFVLLGNHGSGTDSLNNRDDFRACFKEATKYNLPIIIDGVMASPLWVTGLLENTPVEVFVFMYELPMFEHLKRLESRTGAMTEKKISNLRSYIGRAHLFIERLINARKQIQFGLLITVLDERSVQANKELVERILLEGITT